MGQLCSRPQTVEDKSTTDSATVQYKSAPQSLSPFPGRNGDHHVHDTPYSLQKSDASDTELSELDVVVQQLQDNHNAVTGSAPELLQQWDHDHKVVLGSIDAAIQVHSS